MYVPGGGSGVGTPERGMLLAKLYVPPPCPALVPRPRLTERLTRALRPGQKPALVSSPAWSGKTTLLSEWIAGLGSVVPVPSLHGIAAMGNTRACAAWLSLDQAGNDPGRFPAYLIAAPQTIAFGLLDGPMHDHQPENPQ